MFQKVPEASRRFWKVLENSKRIQQLPKGSTIFHSQVNSTKILLKDFCLVKRILVVGRIASIARKLSLQSSRTNTLDPKHPGKGVSQLGIMLNSRSSQKVWSETPNYPAKTIFSIFTKCGRTFCCALKMSAPFCINSATF